MAGIAFPTTISPNHVICHYAPLGTEAELKEGDVVKIELGVHIDGYPSQMAHTLVIGASKENKISGRKADCVMAAYYCAETAVRLVKAGNTNWMVTDAIDKVAKMFDCAAIEGMLSHQIERDVLDGPKRIILNASPEARKDIETVTFEEGEVYSLDILISCGDGKPKLNESRTTIYKRDQNVMYPLKSKSGRAVLNEITSKFGNMAFSMRYFDDQKTAKAGLFDCTRHGLVLPYQVLQEKEGVVVAHFMFTVMVQPKKTLRLSHFPLDLDTIHSEKSITDNEIIELLKVDLKKKK
jgi:curved DNA binding protein